MYVELEILAQEGSVQLGTLAMNVGTFSSGNIISTGYCKVHSYVVLKLLVLKA